MGNKKLAVYLHLVWTTWDRELWISADIERRVFRNIVNQVHQCGCTVLGINGMPDHIHLFIKLSSSITIAGLMKKVKGVSSRFINQRLQIADHFQWQIGYGAFSVSRWDTDKVLWYVRNQKHHHVRGDLLTDLEETMF